MHLKNKINKMQMLSSALEKTQEDWKEKKKKKDYFCPSRPRQHQGSLGRESTDTHKVPSGPTTGY